MQYLARRHVFRVEKRPDFLGELVASVSEIFGARSVHRYQHERTHGFHGIFEREKSCIVIYVVADDDKLLLDLKIESQESSIEGLRDDLNAFICWLVQFLKAKSVTSDDDHFRFKTLDVHLPT